MVRKPSTKELELDKTKEISIPLETGSLQIPPKNIIVKEGVLDQWGSFPRVGACKGKKALLIIYDVKVEKSSYGESKESE